MISVRIRGLHTIPIDLLRKGRSIEASYAAGLKAAGLFLQRQSMKQVPVDTGVLRASAFTRALTTGGRIRVQVGYTTEYAIKVHEILSYAHGEAYNLKHWARIAAGYDHARGKGQKAKFLEDPFLDMINRREMLLIVARRLHAK